MIINGKVCKLGGIKIFLYVGKYILVKDFFELLSRGDFWLRNKMICLYSFRVWYYKNKVISFNVNVSFKFLFIVFRYN